MKYLDLADMKYSGLDYMNHLDLADMKYFVLLQERPLLASALDSALAVALVIAAFDITGGYFRSG